MMSHSNLFINSFVKISAQGNRTFMFCKHTGCTERTTAGTSLASHLTEKLIEMPRILLLPKYTSVKLNDLFTLTRCKKGRGMTQ